MKHLFIRGVCRSADNVVRMCSGKIFNVVQNTFPPLILDATNLADMGRNTGVDENIVFPGIVIDRKGAEDKEPSAVVKLLG